MNIQEIISNGLDLAGGDLIRQKLDTSFATLVCLNIIDTMMLQLASSKKSIRGYKTSMTLAANSNNGSAGTLEEYMLGDRYVRYRRNATDKWEILDVVDEIEELTDAENKGKHVILFVGTTDTTHYYLSWTPTESIVAELWGKILTDEIGNLNSLPPFPPEFSLLAAYRMADFVLNSLLILAPKDYGAFVVAEKGSLKLERDRCEFEWRKYREITSDSASSQRINEYVSSDDQEETGDLSQREIDSFYPG